MWWTERKREDTDDRATEIVNDDNRGNETNVTYAADVGDDGMYCENVCPRGGTDPAPPRLLDGKAILSKVVGNPDRRKAIRQDYGGKIESVRDWMRCALLICFISGCECRSNTNQHKDVTFRASSSSPSVQGPEIMSQGIEEKAFRQTLDFFGGVSVSASACSSSTF
jgi:hypothetical protein